MRLASLLLAALPTICACGSIVGVAGNPGAEDDGSNDPSPGKPSHASAPATSSTAPGSTSTTPPPSPTPSKLAFVTSAVVAGSDPALATTSNADALCNGLAIGAGLGGTFAAWLSDDFGPAIGVVKPGVRYVRPDGLTISSDIPAAMKAKTSFEHAIAIDETGDSHTGSVWTFTNADGNTGKTCSGSGPMGIWPSNGGHGAAPVGTLGVITTDAHEWTESGTSDQCDDKKPIYCFQQ